MASPSTTSSADGVTEWLRLRPGVSLVTRDRSLYLVRAAPGRPVLRLGAPSTATRLLLRRLAAGPCRRADLAAAAGLVDRLRDEGWLVTAVHWDERARYEIQPSQPRPPRLAGTGDPTLSRFAVVRRGGAGFVIESPVAAAHVVVHDPDLLAVLGDLAGAASRDRGHARFVRDLVLAGLAGPSGAESDLAAQQWQPAELWLHARSRFGGGGYDGIGFGRTLWARDRFAPLPSRRPPYPSEMISLPCPDPAVLRATDPTLSAVLQDRRSVRVHDDAHPLTAGQLGELLHRCLRAGPTGRPYPSGGATYELEAYPVVRMVTGLAAGLYHYDPHAHGVRLVRGPGPAVSGLLRAATAQPPHRPQVLIVLTARFGRLMHSYQELGYSLILKHVGAVHQTMYLAATAMGLAGCALGAGDTSAFLAATGLDLATESPVGEFTVGSRTPGEVGRGPVAAS
jgi:SagB-type dehydrogenase family enzyme